MEAMLHFNRVYGRRQSGVWGEYSDCLQWDFDPDTLEHTVGQLAGQMLLVGGDTERAADEIVCFYLGLNGMLRATTEKRVCLGVRNRLTRETATAVLHLFHHLGTGTYIDRLHTDVWVRDRDTDTYESDRGGCRLNQAIFDALQGLREGQVPRLHVCQQKRTGTTSMSIFGEGVRLHSKLVLLY